MKTKNWPPVYKVFLLNLCVVKLDVIALAKVTIPINCVPKLAGN